MMDKKPLYDLIRRFESCRLMPYICPAGVWTCGWGSTGANVVPGVPWTQAYADLRMQRDAEKCLKDAKALCPALDGPALCAIADFVYNIGYGDFKASTLRKRINEADLEKAVHELRRWKRGGGRILKGLVLRREAEVALMLSGGL